MSGEEGHPWVPPSQTHPPSRFPVSFWLQAGSRFIAFPPSLLFLIASFPLGTGRGGRAGVGGKAGAPPLPQQPPAEPPPLITPLPINAPRLMTLPTLSASTAPPLREPRSPQPVAQAWGDAALRPRSWSPPTPCPGRAPASPRCLAQPSRSGAGGKWPRKDEASSPAAWIAAEGIITSPCPPQPPPTPPFSLLQKESHCGGTEQGRESIPNQFPPHPAVHRSRVTPVTVPAAGRMSQWGDTLSLSPPSPGPRAQGSGASACSGQSNASPGTGKRPEPGLGGGCRAGLDPALGVARGVARRVPGDAGLRGHAVPCSCWEPAPGCGGSWCL